MESDNADNPQSVILFMFVGITLGALTNHFLSTVASNVIPYTVLVFIEVMQRIFVSTHYHPPQNNI